MTMAMSMRTEPREWSAGAFFYEGFLYDNDNDNENGAWGIVRWGFFLRGLFCMTLTMTMRMEPGEFSLSLSLS